MFFLFFGVEDIHKTVVFNALYLANIKVALDNSWNGSSHFWSLAVEEQFYLIWFFLIATATKQQRLIVIWAFIVIALAFRASIYLLNLGEFKDFLLPGVADSLAVGALVFHTQDKLLKVTQSHGVKLLFASCVLAIFYCWVDTLAPTGIYWSVFSRTYATIVGVLLLLTALSNSESLLLRWMDWKIIRHIGKVSYGIYIYHYFIPHFVRDHITTGINFLPKKYINGSLSLLILVLVVEFSWHFIERPMLKHKDKLPTMLRSN